MDSSYTVSGGVKNQFSLVKFIKTHKIAVLAIIAVIYWGGYFAFGKINAKEAEVTYRTAPVLKGMIMSSVSGSGQVSMSDQIDIKPKVSGDIVYVGVKAGQEVKSGILLFQISATDALKKVRDAQTDLETAKLELEDFLSSVDELTLLQQKNSLEDARENFEKLKRTQESDYQSSLDDREKAQEDLEDSYEDAFNKIADVFLDLPDTITDLYDTLYDENIAESGVVGYSYWSNIEALKNSIENNNLTEKYKFDAFSESAEKSYSIARDSYDENFDNYKDTRRYSENDVIMNLLEETIETTKKLSEAIKDSTNMYGYWVDYRSQKNLSVYSQVTSNQSTLASLTSTVNSHISTLLSTQNSIHNNLDAIEQAQKDIAYMEKNNPIEIISSERNLQELEKKLEDIQSDPTDLEIRAKRISIQKAQDALVSSQQDLADYYIRAPFDGVIAQVNVSKGESVSSSSVLATVITKHYIAEITLNEIDAVVVEIGQKVMILFDAIEGLSITGEVVEIDTLGTVNQGVVSYGVKIAFDVQDDRVRPGMSIGTSIISESKQNILMVPISAVKTQGSDDYVEILINEVLERTPVETGISNDTMVEITSGLKEGDLVITQTINSGTTSATSPQQQNNASFGSGGGDQVFRMMH